MNAVYEIQHVANHFGVDRRTITRWRKDCPALKEPPFDLDKIQHWRAHGTIPEAIEPDEPQDDDDPHLAFKRAQAEKTAAEARLKEMTLADKQGEYLLLDDVIKTQLDMAGQIRQALISVPSNWADKFLDIRDIAAAKERLDELVESVLTVLSKAQPLIRPGDQAISYADLIRRNEGS